MPVLPPTAASTMPSTVVGRFTNRTPRSQLAATNPARSVVAPPPRPMTTSDRVNPASPSASQQRVRTSADLACLAVRHLDEVHLEVVQDVAEDRGPLEQRRRVDDRDPARVGAHRAVAPRR